MSEPTSESTDQSQSELEKVAKETNTTDRFHPEWSSKFRRQLFTSAIIAFTVSIATAVFAAYWDVTTLRQRVTELERSGEKDYATLTDSIKTLREDRKTEVQRIEAKINRVEDRTYHVETSIKTSATSVKQDMAKTESALKENIDQVERRLTTGIEQVENRLSEKISDLDKKLDKAIEKLDALAFAPEPGARNGEEAVVMGTDNTAPPVETHKNKPAIVGPDSVNIP